MWVIFETNWLFSARGGYIPVFEEGTFSASSDFPHSLHCLDRCLDQFSVISDRDISAFLKLDSGVLFHESVSLFPTSSKIWAYNGHLLPSRFPERFCPPHFAGITLHSTQYMRYSSGWILL